MLLVFGRNVPGAATARSLPGFRLLAILLIALVAHSFGCARPFAENELMPINVANPAELQRYLLSGKPDVAQFRFRGPFGVIEHRDLEIPLGSDITVDA